MLDLHMQRTELSDHAMQFSGGLVANLPDIRAQYIKHRKLQPLKIVISGPPCSGKSALADHLAGLYSLPIITAASFATFASHLSSADKAAVDAAFGPKGTGSLQPFLSAQLCRAALADVAVKNRGYVLDGFPSSLREARETFTDAREWQQEELAELQALQGEAEKACDAAAKADKGKKAGKDMKGAPGKVGVPAIDDVADPRHLVCDLMPSLLVCANLIFTWFTWQCAHAADMLRGQRACTKDP
jgi:hypothetical protein